MQLYEKIKIEDKAAEEKYEALKAKIVGKDVPVEVAEGLGFKVNSNKIVSVEKSGVKIDIEVEVTSLAEVGFSRWDGTVINLTP